MAARREWIDPSRKEDAMAPRRIVTFTWVTADGYFAAADGNLDWVVPDEAQAKTAAKDIVTFDTVLFGRRTYQIFEGFWRHAVVDDVGTVEDPHHPDGVQQNTAPLRWP
jgi:dihydrofolate reductase